MGVVGSGEGIASARARGVPRRTVRMRLALAYGALFLLCGAALLAMSYLFVARFPFPGVVHVVPPSHVRAAGPSRTVHLGSAGGVGLSSRLAKPPPPGAGKSPPPGAGLSGNAVRAAVTAQHAADLHSLLVWFAGALGIMAVASVGLGWLMAGQVLRPLRQITGTARHISEENLHERLALAGPSDEITDLAETIDGLLARLEGAFEAQRAFVANASHELRTPLAMIRASLGVATAKLPPISKDASVLAGKVGEGLDQAERLVEGFLALARAQRGLVEDLAALSLSKVAADTIDARATAAGSARVTLRRDLGEAEVTGSPLLVARLVANLVDNAIAYNQPGGWVWLTTSAEGATARLVIENSGPVVDPALVSQLGRPFRRGGTARTGSGGGVGLGLSIVSAIATAHHGSVELEARADGGMRVTVALPRRRADQDRRRP